MNIFQSIHNFFKNILDDYCPRIIMKFIDIMQILKTMVSVKISTHKIISPFTGLHKELWCITGYGFGLPEFHFQLC